MIVGYAQNGRVREALEIFRRMPERNAVSWNAMLAGFTWNGDVDKALELFQVMPERDVASWNAIITGLAQNGRLDEALKLFDEMPEQNVVSWTSVIAGYAQNGHSEQAINFFQHLQMKGVKPVPDTFTSVLPACADLAALGSGQQIHEDIIRSGYQLDVFVGNALIDMYAKCGCIEDARQVFKRMSRHSARGSGINPGGHLLDYTWQLVITSAMELDIISYGEQGFRRLGAYKRRNCFIGRLLFGNSMVDSSRALVVQKRQLQIVLDRYRRQIGGF